jgi:hypothetical protein
MRDIAPTKRHALARPDKIAKRNSQWKWPAGRNKIANPYVIEISY